MEDQQNGRIYETASPAELGLAGNRGQAPIVRRPGDPEPGPAAPRNEETTP